MEIYTMTTPSMSLPRACAPSALSPMAPVAVAAERAWIPAEAVRPVAVLAAERAPASRVHQAQVQAELAQALPLFDGISSTTSTTGFEDINVSAKRYTDGGSGVPPRGRPV